MNLDLQRMEPLRTVVFQPSGPLFRWPSTTQEALPQQCWSLATIAVFLAPPVNALLSWDSSLPNISVLYFSIQLPSGSQDRCRLQSDSWPNSTRIVPTTFPQRVPTPLWDLRSEAFTHVFLSIPVFQDVTSMAHFALIPAFKAFSNPKYQTLSHSSHKVIPKAQEPSIYLSNSFTSPYQCLY